MNKKIIKFTAGLVSIIILSMLFSFSAFKLTYAGNTNLDTGVYGNDNTHLYTPLEPTAFNQLGDGVTTDGQVDTSNLTTFLGDLFDFGIAIAVALSVIMISWGGILYMTTDSWLGKEDGKEKIKNALYGLALALVCWLILYTINPCLVYFGGGGGCKQPNQILTTPDPNNGGGTD